MEFSRQVYWSGLTFPSPGGLPDSGIEPGSPALQADALPTESLGYPDYIYAIEQNLPPPGGGEVKLWTLEPSNRTWNPSLATHLLCNLWQLA